MYKYVVVETFSTRTGAENFCKSFGVSFADVIFNHGGEGLEARAYEDIEAQGITQEQSKALIAHLTRNIV
jgi:hypothetical protein